MWKYVSRMAMFLSMIGFLESAYADVKVIGPKSNLPTIQEIQQWVQEDLQSRNKNKLMMQLSEYLEQNYSKVDKAKIALCLAELMLYSPYGTAKAEELISLFVVPNENWDEEINAKRQYLQGIIYYIRSQVSTRSNENLKAFYRDQLGYTSGDPLLAMALAQWQAAAQYPENDWGKKAALAVRGLNQPSSHDGLLFQYEMALLFDENASRDTFMSAAHYERVIKNFETGESNALLTDNSKTIEEKIDLITQVSRAYFKVHRFEDALGVNQMGLALYGIDPLAKNLRFNRAFIFKYINQVQEAEHEYEAILRDYPLPVEEQEKTQLKLIRLLNKICG